MKPCLWTICVKTLTGLSRVGHLPCLQPWAVAADAVDASRRCRQGDQDYVRTKLSDGSFQPELYAFGKGGKWSGEVSDSTIDTLFLDIAKVIAVPLAAQRYHGGDRETKLLIMVYWGTTAVPALPLLIRIQPFWFCAVTLNLT